MIHLPVPPLIRLSLAAHTHTRVSAFMPLCMCCDVPGREECAVLKRVYCCINLLITNQTPRAFSSPALERERESTDGADRRPLMVRVPDTRPEINRKLSNLFPDIPRQNPVTAETSLCHLSRSRIETCPVCTDGDTSAVGSFCFLPLLHNKPVVKSRSRPYIPERAR